MYFTDERTGELVCYPKPKRILVKVVDDMFIYGYTKDSSSCVTVDCSNSRCFGEYGPSSPTCEILKSSELMKEVFFSNRCGRYMFKKGMNSEEVTIEKYTKGRGGFPYKAFQRRYEAIENFETFKDKQELVLTDKQYPIANYVKYTFGAEFETSAGYIPEDVCFRDGLIPLRDGSITGLEYSTVVLSGNKGFGLLEQQLKTLKEYTIFDKECSLHFHFGGFPLDTQAIYNLYKLCKKLEPEIQQLVPRLTFKSGQYKASGKDYCKLLPGDVRNFTDIYEKFVGKRYEGSLTEPHPSDESRERKWNITTRYYWVNFINIMCYKVNKTIEFRLLRPSYNFEKITFWLYLFNAILMKAETMGDKNEFDNININSIIAEIYPEELCEQLRAERAKLKLLINTQSNNGDEIGGTVHIEDSMFDTNFTF